jgi:hypothetical protein
MPIGVEASDDLGGPAPHDLDGSGAIASVSERLDVLPCGCGHVRTRDVRDEPRHPENPGVDDDHVGAGLEHEIANERVLVAFRVERPD